MRCYCVALLLLLSQLSSPATAETFRTEGGVNLHGGDYANFVPARPDLNLCKSKCQQSRSCLAFTYVRPSAIHRHGRCYLKHKIGARTASGCCVSGIRIKSRRRARPPAPRIFVPHNNQSRLRHDSSQRRPVAQPSTGDLSGAQVRMGLVTDRIIKGHTYSKFRPRRAGQKSCRRRCALDKRCRAYTYFRPRHAKDTGWCHLKSSKGRSQRHSCCVSGSKYIAALPNATIARPSGQTCKRISMSSVARYLLSGTRADSSKPVFYLHNNPFNNPYGKPLTQSYAQFRGRRVPLVTGRLASGGVGHRWYFNELRGNGTKFDLPAPDTPLSGNSFIRLGKDRLPCDGDAVTDFHYGGGFVVGKSTELRSKGNPIKGYTSRGMDRLVRDFQLFLIGNRVNQRTPAQIRYGIAIEVDTRRNEIKIQRTSSCFKGYLSGPPKWRPELRRSIKRILRVNAKKLTDMWDRHARIQFTGLRGWMGIPAQVDLTEFKWVGQYEDAFEICYRPRTAVGSAPGSPPPQSSQERPPVGREMRRRTPTTGTEQRR